MYGGEEAAEGEEAVHSRRRTAWRLPWPQNMFITITTVLLISLVSLSLVGNPPRRPLPISSIIISIIIIISSSSSSSSIAGPRSRRSRRAPGR